MAILSMRFAATAVVVVTPPFATWYLVGDVSEKDANPHYMFRRPTLAACHKELVIGATTSRASRPVVSSDFCRSQWGRATA